MWHVWNVNPAFTKDGKREIRRRRREALSCERCRRLKVRCDRRLPCGHCQRSKRDDQCHYLSKAAQDPKAAKETPEKRLKATQQDETKSSPDIASVNDASVAETSTSSGSPRQMSPQSVPSPLVENPGALLPFHALSDDQAAARVSDSDLLMRRAGRTYKQPFSSRFRLWNSKYRGETHWLVFVNEFASVSVVSVRLPGNSSYQTLHPRIYEEDITNYSKLPLLKTSPLEFILAIVPTRTEVDGYIENYLKTVEQVYRLVHVPSFRREVEVFWEQDLKNNVEWDWLAQLLMVIGLGLLTSPNPDIRRVKRLFRGAEVCLAQVSFVVRPTILSIKAVCMMVISKHMGAMSCDEYDSCGPLMGIVVRQAMSLGLHRDPASHGGTVSVFEAEMHRRLWTTIMQIEAQQAITSGMPPLIRVHDFNTMPPSNLNDEDFDTSFSANNIITPRSHDEYTDSSFQILLSQSLTPTLEIVAVSNSLTGAFSYAQVLELDAFIRDLLSQVTRLRDILETEPCQTKRDSRSIQVRMLDICLRRILLILHRQYTRASNASIIYPKSYWTLLENSLAIVVHQRQIYDEELCWQTMSWFAEIFKNDFFLATITIGIQLCRKDSPALEDVPASPDETETGPSPTASFLSPLSSPSTGFVLREPNGNSLDSNISTCNRITPRLTILEALKWCQDIWMKKLTKSFCQSKVSELIGEVVRSLERGT